MVFFNFPQNATFSLAQYVRIMCVCAVVFQAAEEPGGLPEPDLVHEEAAARGPSAQMCGQLYCQLCSKLL